VMVRDTARPIDPSDGLYDMFAHARALGEKDLKLALALGEELGVDLPLGRVALDHLAASLGVPHTESEPT
jgi:3-hydroxyisobutyrate dehydrogenase